MIDKQITEIVARVPPLSDFTPAEEDKPVSRLQIERTTVYVVTELKEE